MTTFLIVFSLWYFVGIISAVYWLRKFAPFTNTDVVLMLYIAILGPLVWPIGKIASAVGKWY